ncbi:uncharacterized protein UTRI_03449_B [Ustilago trichophora]|uniref:Uncharacterized protein n=1 Tax=Ustilago trichophora TaxID=86804 RepID=A0A5C3E1U7_9BASI|nr:uncharacterized protein UTRI_03449_B [Ustilago trichophora]
MKLKRKRKASSSLDQPANLLEAQGLRQQQQPPGFVQAEPSSHIHQNPRVTLTGPTSIRISLAAVSDHAKPLTYARRRTSIAPSPRYQPFLDVVTRRASKQAASLIDSRISREAIFHHPTRPDILLGKYIPWNKISSLQIINKQTAPTEITPKLIDARAIAPRQVGTRNVVHKIVVHKNIALKDIAPKHIAPRKTVVMDANPGQISPAGVSSTKAIIKQSTPNDFIPKKAVQNRKRVSDEIAPDKVKSIKAGPKGLPEVSDEHRIPQRQCLFWASSINDMRQCDPYFPPKGASINISRSGTITALLLERRHVGKFPQQSCLVANLIDLCLLSSIDSATFESLQMACIAGIRLRVYYYFDDPGKPYRVVNNSVVTLKVMFWRMCSISSVENQFTANEREVSTHTTSDISDLLPRDLSDQTLLGFRCSAKENSLSRQRKMELSFTGSRSDLGKANMVLTDDDLTKRSLSTFTDGTRICTYYIAASSTKFRSDANVPVLPAKYALHHVLKPGSFERLSPTVEAELRVQGYALGFETQNRGICTSIAAQPHPFSAASREVVVHIARLRQSLELANTASHEIDRQGKPMGCLILLLQNSRLRIDSSFFPATSAHFGILCLSRWTNVSIRRKRSADIASFAADWTKKDVSLGTFVMQSQDAVVGRTELLGAVELELTSKGVSLWAIVHFSAANSTLIKDLPSSHGLHKEQPLAVQDHRRPWSL